MRAASVRAVALAFEAERYVWKNNGASEIFT